MQSGLRDRKVHLVFFLSLATGSLLWEKIRTLREKIRTLKALLDLSLATTIKENKTSLSINTSEIKGKLSRLLILYQPSSLTWEDPVDWKSSNVIPIYKRDWKEDLVNDRPVSLISVPRKVMEVFILRAVTNRGSGSGVCEREVLLDQPNLLLWQDHLLSGWGKTSGYCLPGPH